MSAAEKHMLKLASAPATNEAQMHIWLCVGGHIVMLIQALSDLRDASSRAVGPASLLRDASRCPRPAKKPSRAH